MSGYGYRLVERLNPVADEDPRIGSRPDTTCFLNPEPAYAIDLGYNPDACKRCGIDDDDESIHDDS